MGTDNHGLTPAPGGTLTEHQVEEKNATTRPTLFLALRGDAPLNGGQALDMTGVEKLVIGRGGALALMPGEGPARARLDLPDPTTSGRHARLSFSHEGALLEDLGSRNGTRFRGQVLTQPTRLCAGDWFSIGRSVFVLGRGAAGQPDDPMRVGPSGLLCTFVPEVAALYENAAQLAPSLVPLLLVGETGTGKEVLAREIHEMSRPNGPFVAINCAALPDNLVESELFGYRKGAFSDAREDRPGLIRTAAGGTLLLDEITELSPGSQAKLLRFLQQGEVLALGATQPVKVDVRIVAATQPGLQSAVHAKRFRADLLARLAGFTMNLIPLRNRLPDLGILIAALLRRHAGTHAKEITLSAEACNILFSRRWTLNVRELEQSLMAACVLARQDGKIDAPHLGDEILPAQPELKSGTPDEDDDGDLALRLRESLQRHQGNVSAVARELGKARMQIHRWMERFGLNPDEYRKL